MWIKTRQCKRSEGVPQRFSVTWKKKFVEVKYRCRVEELIVFLF